MGFSGKPHHQFDGHCHGGAPPDGKKWVIAGIPLRAPLQPIRTNPGPLETQADDHHQAEGRPTTPTAVSARIPAVPPCPPAPKKRKPSLKLCSYGGAREFFSPPDLETIFIQRAS